MPLGFAIAIAVPCALWFVQAFLVVKHLAEIRTLARTSAPAPAAWPSVSAIVPTRDEGARLAPALATRLADDYPALELVVVDDRSADETPRVLAELAESDSRVKPVRVDALPGRWLGKVHALARGVEAADGDWLLVSDADIHFEPGALRQAVALCEADGIDFLALVPEFKSRSAVVDVLWAVFIRVFSMAVSPAAVRNPSSKAAAGSGSFMLARRSAYDRTPGFEWLRLETADDMALGLMMKQAGARCELINGFGSARVSIYDSLREFFRGVEKNAGSLAGRPFAVTLLAMLVAGILEFSPIVAMATALFGGHPAWLGWLGAAAYVAATLATVLAVRSNTGLIWPGLLWPVGWPLMAAGITRSVWLAKRRGGVVWRETFYPIADLLEGQRFKIM